MNSLSQKHRNFHFKFRVERDRPIPQITCLEMAAHPTMRNLITNRRRLSPKPLNRYDITLSPDVIVIETSCRFPLRSKDAEFPAYREVSIPSDRGFVLIPSP
jgi:hypothetical protein